MKRTRKGKRKKQGSGYSTTEAKLTRGETTIMEFRFTTDTYNNELTLKGEGHCVAMAVQELEMNYKALIDKANGVKALNAVVLDLVRVKTLDSYGIKLLLSINAYSMAKGIPFRVQVAPHPVTQALMMCKLDRIIEVKEVVG
jgi:anti-anti-sigma factor